MKHTALPAIYYVGHSQWNLGDESPLSPIGVQGQGLTSAHSRETQEKYETNTFQFTIASLMFKKYLRRWVICTHVPSFHPYPLLWLRFWKSVIYSVERQKKLKLAEAETATAEIDKKIAELKSVKINDCWIMRNGNSFGQYNSL